MSRLFIALGIAALSLTVLHGQGAGVTAEKILNPGNDSWPTFNGDYSGRRFSRLTHITAENVKYLSLAWLTDIGPGVGTIKATPLSIDGVLYFSTPNNAFAIDARTGREVWRHSWPSKGGNTIGNRGMAALGETLYFETPDCHLVALNMRDGVLKWSKVICNSDLFYYASVAPTIVRNQVIVGVSGDDIDNPGYVQAHDPVTGEMKWRWYAVPQKKGDPGSETWSNEDVMKGGGGMTWQPVTYDPELNLILVPTGNPQPVIAFKNREGANLFTGSIVALNGDTGQMQWYFQSSPQDTHDWDSTQPAVIYDATIDGQPRKLVAQAARNGHFFVLDRTNGKALVSVEFVPTNWSSGYDEKGQPIPNPAKMPQVPGVLTSPAQGGGTNWNAASLSPRTGLFYINASQSYSVYYIYDASDDPAGWGGTDRGGYSRSMLQAIDSTTGKIRWSHPWHDGQRSGLLSTAGNVLFTGGSGGLTALNATTGDALWNARIGGVSNGPITYELDGLQYVIVGNGTRLVAFVMNR